MNVFLTKRAQKEFNSIKSYIFLKWGSQVADVFEQKVIDFIDIVENFPELGQIELKEKQLRGFQLTKQTRIFYRIKGQRIIILTFFDVRKNPSKRPK